MEYFSATGRRRGRTVCMDVGHCVCGGQPVTKTCIYTMFPVLGKTSLISQTGRLAVAWDGGGIESGGWDTRRHVLAMEMSCVVTLVAFTQLCTFAKIY